MLVGFALLVAPSLSRAADSADDSALPGSARTLPEVVVTGLQEDILSGSSSLSERTIHHLPLKEGSLTEAVSVLPGVQLPSDFRTSVNGGEILAPQISISGGKFYENQILLDGISLNRQVDPANTANVPADIPGSIQAPQLSATLMGEIEVYRYNVPAAYGGFTGGVISSTIREPEPVFSLFASYRTTSHHYTEFHLDEDDQADFSSSTDEDLQPRFRKHDWNLEVDVPFGEGSGGLFAYHQLQSTIPLQHLGGTKVQRRRNDNLAAKLVSEIPRGSVSFSAIYAPYEGKYFKEDTLASDYALQGGGLILAAEVHRDLPVGLASIKAGYSETASERDDAPHHLSWAVTSVKPWGGDVGGTLSKEGGYGNISKGGETLTLHPQIAFLPVRTGFVDHTVVTGFEMTYSEASFERGDQSQVYFSAVVDSRTSCDDGDIACSPGDQFLSRRSLYDPFDAEALLKQYHVYVEDTMTLERLSLRPGIRYSNESITENNNLSPRLAVALDLFGDGGTILRGGANRYYSTSPVTFMLREGIPVLYKERRSLAQVSPTEWKPSAWVEYSRSTLSSRYSDLKTPYADEYAAAIEQQLLSGRGGRLVLEFIRRDGKDEITRELNTDDGLTYLLNNNGRSRHLEYSLAWELATRYVELLLNATYQDSRSSHLDYDDFFDAETAEELVWFDDEVIPRWQLPASDYNRPWSGNFLVTFNLPFKAAAVRFSNLTRYTGHYRDLEKLDTIPAAAPPEVVDAYEVTKRNDVWTFDWTLECTFPLASHQTLTLTLEAFNVFDAKTRVSSEDSDYFLGRQYWAGISYRY